MRRALRTGTLGIKRWQVIESGKRMLVAVVSDIHDNLPALDKVIKETRKRKVKAVIFCGDLCAPFTGARLGDFGVPVYGIVGNADEDHLFIQAKAGDAVKLVGLGPQFGKVELGGKKVAYTHYPLIAEGLVAKGGYDAIFFGHTHRVHVGKRGKTLLANPGEVFGMLGDRGTTFGVYDTKKNEIEIIDIK